MQQERRGRSCKQRGDIGSGLGDEKKCDVRVLLCQQESRLSEELFEDWYEEPVEDGPLTVEQERRHVSFPSLCSPRTSALLRQSALLTLITSRLSIKFSSSSCSRSGFWRFSSSLYPHSFLHILILIFLAVSGTIPNLHTFPFTFRIACQHVQ